MIFIFCFSPLLHLFCYYMTVLPLNFFSVAVITFLLHLITNSLDLRENGRFWSNCGKQAITGAITP